MFGAELARATGTLGTCAVCIKHADRRLAGGMVAAPTATGFVGTYSPKLSRSVSLYRTLYDKVMSTK